MIFSNLEGKLNIHQSIRIIYIIDGYSVTLYADDSESKIVDDASGASIIEALDNLDKQLA